MTHKIKYCEDCSFLQHILEDAISSHGTNSKIVVDLEEYLKSKCKSKNNFDKGMCNLYKWGHK